MSEAFLFPRKLLAKRMTNPTPAEITEPSKGLVEIGYAIVAACESYRLGASVSKIAEDAERRLTAVGYGIASLTDINNLDAVVHALGIEDSHITPAEAVEELKAEIERLRAMTTTDET